MAQKSSIKAWGCVQHNLESSRSAQLAEDLQRGGRTANASPPGFDQLTMAVWRVGLGRILRLRQALWDPLRMSFLAEEREGQHASVIPVQPRASLTLEAEIKGWDG